MLTFHREWGDLRKFDTLAVLRQEGRQLVLQDADGHERRLEPRRTSGFTVGLAKQTPVAVGDRLLVRANLKPAGLRNGDLVTVAGFAPDGGIILKDGRKLPVWFREFSHGYPPGWDRNPHLKSVTHLHKKS